MPKPFPPSSDRVLLLPCSAVGATTDICYFLAFLFWSNQNCITV
uniref:Uncharacterized protein n=1 Tax=Anguilla anguilla TaxID=7936 RepID=A0A0E9Q8F2_ANGAN